MGLVKYGGGITQVSGAIGGDVHARNRFGNYIRPRTKPVNPRSERQEAVRADLSFLAEYWHQELSAAQRAAWEVYAAAVAMTNRLGETIYLTGFNHFMRSNCARRNFDNFLVEDGPVVLSLPETDPTLTCTDEGVVAQTFTFTCDNTGWAANGDQKLRILLYQGLPQLVSRTFFAGPWRFMDVIDSVEGAAGTGTFSAVFPFGVGQKVWFQARLFTLSGRVTNLWQVSPRTIVADV